MVYRLFTIHSLGRFHANLQTLEIRNSELLFGMKKKTALCCLEAAGCHLNDDESEPIHIPPQRVV